MSLFSIKTEVRGQGRGFIHRYEVKRSANKQRRYDGKKLIEEMTVYYLQDLSKEPATGTDNLYTYACV